MGSKTTQARDRDVFTLMVPSSQEKTASTPAHCSLGDSSEGHLGPAQPGSAARQPCHSCQLPLATAHGDKHSQRHDVGTALLCAQLTSQPPSQPVHAGQGVSPWCQHPREGRILESLRMEMTFQVLESTCEPSTANSSPNRRPLIGRG